MATITPYFFVGGILGLKNFSYSSYLTLNSNSNTKKIKSSRCKSCLLCSNFKAAAGSLESCPLAAQAAFWQLQPDKLLVRQPKKLLVRQRAAQIFKQLGIQSYYFFKISDFVVAYIRFKKHSKFTILNYIPHLKLMQISKVANNKELFNYAIKFHGINQLI